jgi:hypothetical protein
VGRKVDQRGEADAFERGEILHDYRALAIARMHDEAVTPRATHPIPIIARTGAERVVDATTNFPRRWYER